MANNTYKQVLKELPVDENLQEFLCRFGIAIPEDIEMSDVVIKESSEAIAKLIDDVTTYKIRENIDTELVSLFEYKSRTANKAIYDAVAYEPDAEKIQNEIDPLFGSVHRALWLYLHSPKVLSRASGFLLFDNMQNVCGRLQLEEGLVPVLTEQNKKSLCSDLSDYYIKNQSCGKIVDLDVTERKENRWHFHILISGRPEKEDIYNEDDELVPQSIRRPLHVSFEYSSDSGIIEITEKNFKLRNIIIKTFAKHYLGKEINPYDMPIPDMKFGCFLAESIESSVANEYQIDEIQVQRLDFTDEDDGAVMSFSSKGKGTASIYAKLGLIFDDKTDDLTDVLKDIEISSVTLKFHLAKWQSSFSAKDSFSVTLKKKGIGWGRLNETEKDKVLDILADLGVVDSPATDYDKTWELICRLFKYDSSIRDAAVRKGYPDAFDYLKKHGALVIGKDRSRAINCPNCGELVEIAEDENGNPVCICENCLSYSELSSEMLRVWTLRREWLLQKIAAAFGLPPRKHVPAPIVVLGEYDRHNIVVAQDIDLIAHNVEQLTRLRDKGLGEPWIIAPSKADCHPAGMKFIPFEDSFKFSGNGFIYRDFNLDGILPTDSRFPVHGGFSHDYMWYTDKDTGKRTKMTVNAARIFCYMDNMSAPETAGSILRGAGIEGTSLLQYFKTRSDDEKERRAVFDKLVKTDESGKYYLENH